jgi:hypothetical protein
VKLRQHRIDNVFNLGSAPYNPMPGDPFVKVPTFYQNLPRNPKMRQWVM